MQTRLIRGIGGMPAFMAALGIAATTALWIGVAATAQGPLDADDIGGVVRSPNGPEAGVWVIAETDDFDTRFRKIVVTDDAGRYVLPDLPEADYDIWVRGYGLRDSEPVSGRPGVTLDLDAVIAADAREAAQVYPANYWYSLVEVPAEDEFPGTGDAGNGISPGMRHQAAWIDGLKQGCQLCHQLGNLATREVLNPGDFDSTEAAWAHRVRVGQRGALMAGGLRRFGAERAIAMYADWTDRIMAGEVPPAPPRPRGRERNVVLTLWEWGGETGYIHDEIATDKRNPQVNAGGPVYGVEFANDKLVWVDPRTNEAREVVLPVRDTPGEGDFRSYIDQENLEPSIYWGDELVWNNPGNPHNPMMDGQGRVWMTHQIRGPGNPAWCREGSDNPYARHYPLNRAARHVAYYDPASEHVELIDTCFNTHHLQFGFEDGERLYLSSVGPVIGWLDVDLYEETGDAEAAQGWCPLIVDTNGDGRITEWVGRAGDVDPALDKEMGGGWYGIVPDPTADSVVWAASGGVPGQIVRLELGDNPPETCIAEYYQPPFENPRRPDPGVLAAGHRHRHRRHRVDRPVGQRAHGQLRPRPVRRAERAYRHRAALLPGVDPARDPGAPDEGSHHARERRLPLLQLGRPARHAGARAQRPHRHRQHVGLAARVPPRRGGVRDPAGAVPDGLLLAGHGRPHRRPRRGVEGTRGVGRLRHQRGVALGGRQGHAGEPGEVPDSPRPAGPLADRRSRASAP